MGNNTLSYKESTTYLGLILGSKLTWDLQIKETKKKITKYCSIFRKVRHFLSKTCRLQLYNAFIFSRLNYGIEIYLNATKGYTIKLLSTQNRFLKILQFKPLRSNINKLNTDFEVLKAHDLHEFNIYCLIHKLYYRPNVVPETIKNIFIQHENIHQYNTRH